MADHGILKNIELLKNTRISVFVDEALPDILVVTYEFGVQIFKGVLLDSTKRGLPYGINQLNPAFKNPTPPTKPKLDDDQLYSVNQRYAYTDPNLTKKKNVQISTKYKNSKMTVRLRPRQVLCSKCKGICTENSENVSRKRKTSETSSTTTTTNSTLATTTMITAQPTVTTNQPAVKRSLNAPITRSVYSEMNNGKKLGEATLVPRLTRLTPEEELSILNNSNRNLNDEPKKALTVTNNKENTQQDNNNKKHSIEHSDESSNPDDQMTYQTNKSAKRILRKKRSIGSMEDLWDESVFEENTNKNNQQQDEHNPSNLTRTIKISYGPQGEGTVLKIPALNVNNNSEENIEIDNNDDDNNDNGGNGDNNIDNEKQIDDKAVRRALKKAKKEARRKVFVPNSSPHYLTSSSPRYMIGGSSPRYTVGSASPRHGLGNNSPRYMCASTYDLKVPRRRKHKVKHKKKHKEDRDKKYKDNDIVSSTQSDDVKEQYVTQKLSINLKRLNNTYASFPTTSTSSTTTTTTQPNKIDENTSSSDEHSEQVPDFPPPNSPLMLRINSQTLPSVPTVDGGRMLVGDVVWGKIHGFPWWPGKVLTITNCGSQGPQAHVAWYGSSTSSLMQCDQLSPYLENFKIRYNKKKRGPYKEAIRQATLEAKENAEIKMRQPLGNSPQHKIITQVVPPALASPREIDVVS